MEESQVMKILAAIASTLLLGSAARADSLLINGAGATFPYPLYSKWFAEYHKLHPELSFNYQSIGSGGGIQQITQGTVDFGASDAPLNEEQLAKIPDIVHIPTVMGAVVVTYNAPVKSLKLTPEALADIFLGKITKWNDPALAELNHGEKLPDAAISVAHRSDGSGTTYGFVDYLCKVSPEWKEKVGKGTSVKWPVGLGGKGNEGVTGLVKQTPGAIGYVELAYANQNKLPLAELRNQDGHFVKPTLEATSAAAAGIEMPADYRVSITNAGGKTSWPIASFTYLLVHKNTTDAAKGEAMVKFLWWATHEGQKMAAPLDYAPLPPKVVHMLESTIKSLTVQGKHVNLATR
jgi:phosphate transport system substrate-binding protein